MTLSIVVLPNDPVYVYMTIKFICMFAAIVQVLYGKIFLYHAAKLI